MAGERDYLERAVLAELRAELRQSKEEFASLAAAIDVDSFVTGEGEIDSDAISRFVRIIAPATAAPATDPSFDPVAAALRSMRGVTA